MRARHRTLKLGAALLLCGALSACSATYRNHGYAPLDEDLSQITVGVDTRDTVAEVVGTPSSGGVLSESGYYYVQSRVKHFAWQKPEVIEREVVAVSFTEAGIVENIGRYTLQDGQVVPLARRITRNGQDVSFIRKLLANLGRFSASDFIN
ncbi:outer membrane protein assembly factor BamE [Planktotalea arctica]|uniref:outer membrane protein assembly factor BamE n=1 Tax=Planktotalea arctica TaxID=1481893 RepID=UPI000A171408|nr:outer membrane protein assembly factor BamE [Planktotalea arctica]